MAASAILLVDDSCDGPAALRLPLRQLYALALVDYKTQRISSFEVCGHLKRVHADGGRPRDGFRLRRHRLRSKPTPSGKSVPRRWRLAA